MSKWTITKTNERDQESNASDSSGEILREAFPALPGMTAHNNFIHPMHIHGGPFAVVARDGVALGRDAKFVADTINVGPGQRYDVIWTACEPDKWLVHCHIPHHTTNNNQEPKGDGGLMLLLDVTA